MSLESDIVIISLLLFISSVAGSNVSVGAYNVKDYGATGDGKTDSTNAFIEAWSAACAVEGKPTILIPEGSYLIGPLIFKGPCKDVMVVRLQGQLLASTNLKAYTRNWIEFQYIDGLIITGTGTLNGQGASSWSQNLCPKRWDCKLLPMSLVLSSVTNSTIRGISSVDSKLFHVNVFGSKDITFDSIKISAPGDSPNTDGIHIGGSTNIAIINSVIGTGDDCVSVGPGNTNVTISNVLCGPGHGISVGSLGKLKNEKDVVGLTVRNCTLAGTTNGVRIKSWQSSPTTLSATGFIFEDIVMKNVSNPIIIDQKYCPYVACAGKDPSLVKIKDVKFNNIRGTSASPEVIKIVCSDSLPCEGVELNDITFEFIGDKRFAANVTSTCVNVHGSSNGNVKPNSCI